MLKKSERTKLFIIEKTAPIFNKKGYLGLSLSDITNATKMTKGAIYCNFDNKEALVLEAYKYNIKKYVGPLIQAIAKESSALGKIHAVLKFYRNYYQLVKNIGGCPILNVGIDSKNNNSKLFLESKKVSKKLLKGLINIIEQGVTDGDFKSTTGAATCAKAIYAQIEGGAFLAFLNEDDSYLENSMSAIENYILPQIKVN